MSLWLSPPNCVPTLLDNAFMSPNNQCNKQVLQLAASTTTLYTSKLEQCMTFAESVGAQPGMASVTAQTGQCLCCNYAVAMGRHVTGNAAMAFAPSTPATQDALRPVLIS